MATFLQLCQKAHLLLRPGPQKPGTSPTDVATTADPEVEIVGHVRMAWNDVQVMHPEWSFMSAQGAFNTTAAQRLYTVANIVAQIPLYAYLQPFNGMYRHLLVNAVSVGVSDQTYCHFIPYENWRGNVDRGTRPSSKPTRFTVHPDGSLEFDATPDAVYRIALDYKRSIQTLTANGDIPLMPVEYHDLIAWKAVENYCITRQDRDRLGAQAKEKASDLLGQLAAVCLPELTIEGIFRAR